MAGEEKEGGAGAGVAEQQGQTAARHVKWIACFPSVFFYLGGDLSAASRQENSLNEHRDAGQIPGSEQLFASL